MEAGIQAPRTMIPLPIDLMILDFIYRSDMAERSVRRSQGRCWRFRSGRPALQLSLNFEPQSRYALILSIGEKKQLGLIENGNSKQMSPFTD